MHFTSKLVQNLDRYLDYYAIIQTCSNSNKLADFYEEIMSKKFIKERIVAEFLV